MNLDDEVRRHLRDTGEQVALTPGLVDAVRIRAATRSRRRRRLFSGLSSLVAIAIVGGSIAVLFGGGDQDPTSLEVATPIAAVNESEESKGGTTQDSGNQALIAATSPTYMRPSPSRPTMNHRARLSHQANPQRGAGLK